MGSGSSKAGASPPPKNNKPAPPKPVANVNKQDVKENQNVTALPIQDKGRPSNAVTNLHLSGPIAPIESNKSSSKAPDTERDNEKTERDNYKEKKSNSKSKKSIPNANHNPSVLQFEDDSDVDDDIDAVLKIPMANEPSKRNKDKKNKKDKNNDKENIDSNPHYDDYGGYNHAPFHQPENDYIPETYAQRLQRKQYKLQQDMLIREKTSMKNLRDWQNDADDEDEDLTPTPRGGFDASKFRAANKGGDIKQDFFSSVKDDLETPRYLQTSGQDLDEVETNRRQADSPNMRLPQYNQSEIDLMRQLENDIL